MRIHLDRLELFIGDEERERGMGILVPVRLAWHEQHGELGAREEQSRWGLIRELPRDEPIRERLVVCYLDGRDGGEGARAVVEVLARLVLARELGEQDGCRHQEQGGQVEQLLAVVEQSFTPE